MTTQNVDEVPELIVRRPADGSLIASYPIAGAAEVNAAVQSAAAAGKTWREAGFKGRRRVLLRWKAQIARDAAGLAETIAEETGKPLDDALLEVMITLGHLDWAARNAEPVLRRRKVKAGLMNYNQRASLGYEPYGVVGVIGPWNYPIYTPMGSIAYALAAGNAVVYKPSELTPGTGVWLARAWAKVSGDPVLQVITGDGTTGDALVRSAVDKVAFTGSTETARKVMRACSDRLVPLVAECGGKDALIVAADADLEAAAEAVVFGSMGNAGQTCAGVERVYVAREVRDVLVAKVVERVHRLKVSGDHPVYGAMTLAKQSDVVAAHVADALTRGGQALVGGPESVDGRFVAPVVLVDVPEDSLAIQEETFGPTVVINAVDSMADAVARANATPYGLAASVFTKNARQADQIAHQLRTGAVAINSVLGFASIPALPFGGVKESGFGRIHGADGLREFSVPKSIARQTMQPALKLLTLERKAHDMARAVRLLPLLHGRAK